MEAVRPMQWDPESVLEGHSGKIDQRYQTTKREPLMGIQSFSGLDVGSG